MKKISKEWLIGVELIYRNDNFRDEEIYYVLINSNEELQEELLKK